MGETGGAKVGDSVGGQTNDLRQDGNRFQQDLVWKDEPGCPSTTMRRGYTPSRPYLSRETNRVSHDLRGPTIPAMSP